MATGSVGIVSNRIKSIQRGQYSNAAAPATVDITISAIDVTKAIVLIDIIAHEVGRDLTAAQIPWSAKILNSTTIRLEKVPASNSAKINWQVIEFNNVKSLQTGSQNYPSGHTTEQTVTISSINTSKSIIVSTFRMNAFVSLANGARIISSTSIGLDGRVSTDITHEWQVIEFY